MTVTSSSTQLVDVSINRLEQVRLGYLSCGHKQHALDKHDRDILLVNRLRQARLGHLSCGHRQHALDKHDRDIVRACKSKFFLKFSQNSNYIIIIIEFFFLF